MIRTKTTLVIGPGAGLEIELPDKRELLNKIAGGFDFARLGSELQTRDMYMLAKHFDKFGRQMGGTRERLMEAAQAIRVAARVGTTREMVCRALYNFSDKKLIEVTRTEFGHRPISLFHFFYGPS